MTTDTFALHYLLHAGALLEERLRERLARIGVKPRQARIIEALSRMEPTSQIALAREFDITPASMSTMTVRLIEAGHISREPHPGEARSNMLRLTERGRGLLSEIHAAWRDIDALIVDRLGDETAATLAQVTRELRDSLGGQVPGAGSVNTSRSRKAP
ncbi:MarR family winged helix-turn-helix transcriptional regulator [Profundibacterium mesophilum]|uniref:Transcriptional regulator n=1 Tax=Profundibacterium mesophilum KAUST100406-0324 TaxID=1037889 RepID=A0A921NR32_9RHOB|nr:MarR family winged helix-turn-helix transcriptional regulator [Profundibacterium mesophilum]KAF0675872.1 putative transcriptional regulator [Profundibacterium mesophilum KAUST100406-0324]